MHTFTHTTKTVRAVCVRVFLPEPIHVSFLNKYDCVLEFLTEFELHKVVVDLQQISQWFGYDVVIIYEVVTKDKLNDNEQGRVETNPPTPVWISWGKISELPVSLPNKSWNR